MATADHTVHSSLREKLIEHLFVGEIMRELWRRGHRDIELLHAEVDNAGYDLVLETGGVMRHIQLKASHLGATTSNVNIQTALSNKPSGCVVWIWFDPDTLAQGPFLWKGGVPGQKLPDLGNRRARHTRGNAQGEKKAREGLRVVSKTGFERIEAVSELVDVMFG